MRLKTNNLIISILLLFLSSCLHVASDTVNQAKETDFAAISNQLLDMQKHDLIDSTVGTEKLPDAALKKTLLDMHIEGINIHGRPFADWYLDSIVAYEQSNRNLSIRLYQWEKGTTILYDYATRIRDLSAKRDEFSSPVKKIKDRLYIYKYKEPGIR
jgi:hypothetical protein